MDVAFFIVVIGSFPIRILIGTRRHLRVKASLSYMVARLAIDQSR